MEEYLRLGRLLDPTFFVLLKIDVISRFPFFQTWAMKHKYQIASNIS